MLRLYYLTSYASMGVFLPFISPWLVAYGISGFQLSVVSATRPLAGMLAPLFFGWLADRFRLRGSLMQWACITSVVPFSVISIFLMAGHRVGVLSAFIAVAAFSFLRVPMLTIADVTALERTQHFGSLRLWGSMGFLLAALGFGAMLTSPGAVAFPLTISLSLLAAVAAARKLPQRAELSVAPAMTGGHEYFARREHVLMVAVWILWSASHVAYDMCISLYVHDLGGSPKHVSLAWGIGTLAEVVLMAACGVVLPKAAHSTWTFVGLLLTTVRWAVLSQVRSLSVLLLLQPLHALSFALLWMTWLDYVKQNAPSHLLGRAQGMLSTAVSIGAAAGMFVWGPLYASAGASNVFLGATGVAAVASLLALVPLLGSNVQWQGTSDAS
jgi:PPP family 3-phenylpropionic acid transporter